MSPADRCLLLAILYGVPAMQPARRGSESREKNSMKLFVDRLAVSMGFVPERLCLEFAHSARCHSGTCPDPVPAGVPKLLMLQYRSPGLFCQRSPSPDGDPYGMAQKWQPGWDQTSTGRPCCTTQNRQNL